ncbi:hypothetical protein OROGR_016554 [Orobanche gracilis]
MDPRRGFDNVKHEKEKAIARFWFNRCLRVVRLWQLFEVLVFLGLISWSSGRAPAVLRATAVYFVEFLSYYLFNHHVVFLIGNAIIVLPFMLCRRNDASVSGAGDFYDDYVKYRDASHQRKNAPLPPPRIVEDSNPGAEENSGGDDEKQLVVRAQKTETTWQCDDGAAAIEEAKRQIERFQRTQSEKLKREISVRPQPRSELRRSEMDNRLERVSFGSPEASEIETLSSEEFRRRVDAFIDEHWSGRRLKQIQFGKYENYRLTFLSP